MNANDSTLQQSITKPEKKLVVVDQATRASEATNFLTGRITPHDLNYERTNEHLNGVRCNDGWEH